MENRLYSQIAEEIVLGFLLRSQTNTSEEIDRLQLDYFFDSKNKAIFKLMNDIVERKGRIDHATFITEATENNTIAQMGGTEHINKIVEEAIVVAQIDDFVEKLIEKYNLRKIKYLLTEANEMLVDQNNYHSEQIIDQIEDSVNKVLTNKNLDDFSNTKEEVMTFLNELSYRMENGGGLTGLTTGYKELDKYTAGFQAGDLIIIGARPSMGKTAFALNLAQQMISNQNKKYTVAFFSLEMGTQSLLTRMISSIAMVESEKIRAAQMSDDDWEMITDAANSLKNANLFIDDTPGLNISQLRLKARQLKKQHGLDIIIIDYLQLLQYGGKSDNRQQEVSAISRNLKAIARELEVPVIALSQLSRNLEQRGSKDRRPMLSDLRESGSIEQDADVIMFLYREDYYNPDVENKDITEIIIGKQRNGPTGVVKLSFEKKYNTFYSIAYEQE